MTDKMLAMARAVYPYTEWFDDAGMCWMTAARCTGLPISIFDPANDSDQAIDVWCWLIGNHNASDHYGVIEVERIDGKRKGYPYDGPQQWRKAVTMAALGGTMELPPQKEFKP